MRRIHHLLLVPGCDDNVPSAVLIAYSRRIVTSCCGTIIFASHRGFRCRARLTRVRLSRGWTRDVARDGDVPRRSADAVKFDSVVTESLRERAQHGFLTAVMAEHEP